MKNLSNFEAFRIGKSQMAKLSGGSIVCDVIYDDDLGGSFQIRIEQKGATTGDAQKTMQAQHPDAKVSCSKA